jgi:hypothetical protein
MGDQALSTRGAAVGACHVGLGPGLVDEDEAGGIDARLMATPVARQSGWEQRGNQDESPASQRRDDCRGATSWQVIS